MTFVRDTNIKEISQEVSRAWQGQSSAVAGDMKNSALGVGGVGDNKAVGSGRPAKDLRQQQGGKRTDRGGCT